MKLYLKDINNNILFECEVWVKSQYENNLKWNFVELKPYVNIDNYSKFLLINKKNVTKIISDFTYLNQLDGWLWDRFLMTGKNDATELDDVIMKLKIILGKIAKDYNLILIGEGKK